ncbi:MAG: FtsX-like permease family protein [Acidobacteria bacterium]|nr:FtsX-like permease family protein [Acidobacteriota bacterium]
MTGPAFVVRMAAREMRASWRRLLFFFVCVAVGVGAIVALRSVVQTVKGAIAGEARTLLAADVLIWTDRPWVDETRAFIDERLATAPVRERTEAIETATMVRPRDESKRLARMVELQGVSPGFPLHGTVELEGGMPYDHALLADRGALVRPELLAQLDVAVGDEIVIGSSVFTIRGVVLREPGRRVGFFSLGPRVLVDRGDLEQTGLLTFGSRARYQMMLRVDDAAMASLVESLGPDLRERFVRIRSYRGTEDRLGENLTRAENYLSLVGFVIVILGGIGVWSVTRVFVRQKLKSIAVLKCLGASTAQVLGVYVAQVLLLGLTGSLLGVGIAAAALAAVPETTLEGFGSASGPASVALTASAVWQGVGIGVLVSLLFSLVPLLEVRRIRPLLLLRDSSASEGAAPRPTGWRARAVARLARADWVQVAAGVAVTVALVVLASWQAASLQVGIVVSLGFVGVAFALHLAGVLLVRLVRPLRFVRWFPLRHAVISFGRPGNQTRVILLAVGVGAFFIIGVQSLQSNLLDEFSLDLRTDGPDFFLVDIQPDQEAGVRSFLEQNVPGYPSRLLPVVRARVTGVMGREAELQGSVEVRGQGRFGREYVVTYRDQLEENERVVAGAFWTGPMTGEPEVSIEDGIRERWNVELGDLMRFDVLGREVVARVTSVREVQWADARSGGFMFVFRPGLLDQAPRTYIAVTRGPDEPRERAALQRALVERFPNVSAIDVREVAKTVEGVIENVTLAVSIVGAVALLSGILILVGSVAMTKFQRLHEAAVFKTLGASTRTMTTMLALEYGTLGTLAGLVGALGSVALTWAVSRHVLQIPWSPAGEVALVGVVVTAALVGALGVASSLDVLRRKPLSILRAE